VFVVDVFNLLMGMCMCLLGGLGLEVCFVVCIVDDVFVVVDDVVDELLDVGWCL